MYLITIEKDFDAAHYLKNYHGKCENLHGHRYVVRVTVRADKLDENGLAFDFTELKQYVGDIINRFDHTCLNDISPFKESNASAENIATAVYNELKLKLGDAPVNVDNIEVFESPTSKVTYIP